MAFGRLFDGNAETYRHVGANPLPEARAVDHTRRHVIDVDVVGTELEREALGDAAQAPLGRGIGHAPRASAHAEGPSNIDTFSVAMRHHGRMHGVYGMYAAVLVL